MICPHPADIRITKSRKTGIALCRIGEHGEHNVISRYRRSISKGKAVLKDYTVLFPLLRIGHFKGNSVKLVNIVSQARLIYACGNTAFFVKIEQFQLR